MVQQRSKNERASSSIAFGGDNINFFNPFFSVEGSTAATALPERPNNLPTRAFFEPQHRGWMRQVLKAIF